MTLLYPFHHGRVVAVCDAQRAGIMEKCQPRDFLSLQEDVTFSMPTKHIRIKETKIIAITGRDAVVIRIGPNELNDGVELIPIHQIMRMKALSGIDCHDSAFSVCSDCGRQRQGSESTGRPRFNDACRFDRKDQRVEEIEVFPFRSASGSRMKKMRSFGRDMRMKIGFALREQAKASGDIGPSVNHR